MSQKIKVIDTSKWARKTAYDNFLSYTNPVFAIATRLDVTNLVDYCNKHKVRFFSTMLYLVTKCANQVEQMRYRIEDGNVVEYDVVNPSYIVLRSDDSIATSMTKFVDNFATFYANATADIEVARTKPTLTTFENGNGAGCIYFSSLQWMDVVAVIDPYNLVDSTQTSIPRITWGKYVQTRDGRYEMGLNISAHHALMDGVHVGRVVQNINLALQDVENFLR